MDPLKIAGGRGKGIDQRLVHGKPIADRHLLAQKGLQLRRIGENAGHDNPRVDESDQAAFAVIKWF